MMSMKAEKKDLKKVAKKAAKKAVKYSKYNGRHSAVMNHSRYMATIVDAVNNPGEKIPDANATPSFCVQVLTRVIVTTTTGTGGNTGCGFGLILGKTILTANGSTYSPGAIAGSYTGVNVSASSWGTTLVNSARATRLVSAKITAQYLGAPNNASGRFVISFVSPGDANFGGSAASGIETASISVGALAAEALSADVPASKLYCEARYLPSDDISRTYEVTGSSACGTTRGPQASNLLTYGAFFVILDGAPVSQSVEICVWQNFECLPNFNSYSLSNPVASYSDPIELAAVSNALNEAPQISASQSSDQERATAQSLPNGISPSVRPQPQPSGPSFLDKVMSVADKAIDVGTKYAPQIASIAALLL
jgi:hypothetical protein